MVTQRSSMVRALIACGFAVASLSLESAAHASNTGKHKRQEHSKVAAERASVSGPKSNPEKKAEAKAAREKKKAEKAAQKAEKLAKAKAAKKGEGEKVAKADSKSMNDDMGGSDDPLEGL